MIIKPLVAWTKITERLPAPDQECLVWTGTYMLIATAHVYSEEERKMHADAAKHPTLRDNKVIVDSLLNSKGQFKDVGQSFRFDDDKVYWSPIPLAPGEENAKPDMFESMAYRDVYLKQGEYTIGIHAIGYDEPYEYTEIALDGTVTVKKTDFSQMEIWGNEYNEQFQMIGRGSFRIFDLFDKAVADFEKEGWVRIEGPKKDRA